MVWKKRNSVFGVNIFWSVQHQNMYVFCASFSFQMFFRKLHEEESRKLFSRQQFFCCEMLLKIYTVILICPSTQQKKFPLKLLCTHISQLLPTSFFSQMHIYDEIQNLCLMFALLDKWSFVSFVIIIISLAMNTEWHWTI